MTPHEYARLMVDPVRLALMGQAVAGAVDIDGLALDLKLDRRVILVAASKLVTAGVLNGDYSVNESAVRDVARQLNTDEPADPAIVSAGWTPAEARVLQTFFQGKRLTSVPASQSKRLIVLERLAQEFEPGIEYPEQQVNFMLMLFYADYATLRRYLVDADYLSRADGVYWRSGGRYATIGDPVSTDG